MKDSKLIPAIDADFLRNNGRHFYRQWLSSGYRQALAKKEMQMPSDILQEMVKTQINEAEGDSTIQEAIIAKLVELAMNGNLNAITKVYDELQHQGVQKHAIINQHNIALDPAVLHVLNAIGYAVTQSPAIESQHEEIEDLVVDELDDLMTALSDHTA